jgi:hypothetical protein
MAEDPEMERMIADINAWPDHVRFAVSRRFNVEHCLIWRRKIRKGGGDIEMMRFLHRQCQKKLLKLRIWRATGRYPGGDN